MDFHYSKSGALFSLHPFWTKQPLEPISYFINEFTSPGETVFDPFGGTGTVGVASLINNRRSIINDISPICRHITQGYTTNFKTELYRKEILDFIERIKFKSEPLYKTKCSCGRVCDITFSVIAHSYDSKSSLSKEIFFSSLFTATKENIEFKYSKELKFLGFELIKICYKCICQDNKIYKTPDCEDIKLFNSCLYENLFYPKDYLFGIEPKRNFKKGIKQVFQLYSKRNLSALSIIYEEIKNTQNNLMQKLYFFAFTSILFNCSLLSRYRHYENTSIKMGTFYLPPLIKDNNVLQSFISKLNLISKTNNELFSDRRNSDVLILQDNADNLISIPDATIDYIYTDPPYTDVISYSELNLVWESWLGEKTNIIDEIIVNKFQNKDISYYESRFTAFLNECYRVLRPDKCLTLVFHHPNIQHWISLQNAFNNIGFDFIENEEPIRLISKSRTSSQHSTQKYSQCFLVFNFKKSINKQNTLVDLNDNDFTNLIKKLSEDAEQRGYILKADKFDFIIYHLFSKYKIKDFSLS